VVLRSGGGREIGASFLREEKGRAVAIPCDLERGRRIRHVLSSERGGSSLIEKGKAQEQPIFKSHGGREEDALFFAGGSPASR